MEELIEKIEALRKEAEFLSIPAESEFQEEMYLGRESAFEECIKILLGEK